VCYVTPCRPCVFAPLASPAPALPQPTHARRLPRRHSPRELSCLSRGQARRGELLATAQQGGHYVSPADRYAVVPGGGGPGAAAVPGGSLNGAADGGDAPPLKRARVVAADAAVPEV
jgi:hypothetical protein